MSITTLSTCSLEQQISSFNILGDLNITIHVRQNPYQLPLEALFQMAARINKKRSFLFVSKVLGKHLPVRPSASVLSGMALAARLLEEFYSHEVSDLPEIVQGIIQQEKSEEILHKLLQHPLELPEPLLFIGFAETATALGHSMFSAFGSKAEYIHTTRELIKEIPSTIDFEEEHSHAVAHHFYPLDKNFLHSSCPIVLVDDEITTGKTALNIIREIQQHFPRKQYIVASLLDWRSPDDHRKFLELEAELGIEITAISLIKGEIEVNGVLGEQQAESTKPAFVQPEAEPTVITLETASLTKLSFSSIDQTGFVNTLPYLQQTGRFGMTSEQQRQLHDTLRELGQFLQQYRKGTTLCMGTGEFMYVPMMIAASMGDGVWYQSTTRSPIHPATKETYAVQNAFAYESPDDPTVRNFMYNIPEQRYDELFLFLERGTSVERLNSLYAALAQLPIPNKYLVMFR
ncbi:phosphoribosyltransferase family protein [Brevibacillus brevis]|uniref:phosphoribosyltransferase family protein n=1 Tax=Brevibacillus brevis TaxID=1393 RepID=UPI0025A561E7|nr:phosphoribosyltransferase family protein [Brevibacillus brevis]WJQ81565.1 phosphoribosyltransferase family protein [Brevibacillus brevis]